MKKIGRIIQLLGAVAFASLAMIAFSVNMTFAQDEGGVTATDWRDWLDGKTLRGRSRHSGKHHLRLVASR